MPSGRSLTMLLEPEPPTLVALTNCGDPSMFVSAKVTEGLLAYDFNLTPRPQLATAWSATPDSKEFTFHLRHGVRWHDGAPFTSRDVASAIALLRDVHGRGGTTFANVVGVRTPDPHTAVIALSQPAPFLLYAGAASLDAPHPGEPPPLPRQRRLSVHEPGGPPGIQPRPSAARAAGDQAGDRSRSRPARDRRAGLARVRRSRRRPDQPGSQALPCR